MTATADVQFETIRQQQAHGRVLVEAMLHGKEPISELPVPVDTVFAAHQDEYIGNSTYSDPTRSRSGRLSPRVHRRSRSLP